MDFFGVGKWLLISDCVVFDVIVIWLVDVFREYSVVCMMMWWLLYDD